MRPRIKPDSRPKAASCGIVPLKLAGIVPAPEKVRLHRGGGEEGLGREGGSELLGRVCSLQRRP